MYLMRNGCRWSFPQIAAAFDGRDHTTVMSNCEKMEILFEDDQSSVADLKQIRLLCEGKSPYVAKAVSDILPETPISVLVPLPVAVPAQVVPAPDSELTKLAQDLTSGWSVPLKVKKIAVG